MGTKIGNEIDSNQRRAAKYQRHQLYLIGQGFRGFERRSGNSRRPGKFSVTVGVHDIFLSLLPGTHTFLSQRKTTISKDR
jgi:hypothetical protein